MSFSSTGFSLLELMIAIAIIGILSLIALPSYQQYVARARFTEVIAATEIYKLAVSLAIQEGNAIDELTTNSHGIPDSPVSTKNLANVEVSHGVITAMATELIHGETYVLTPNADASRWTVSGSCVKSGLCHE